MLTNDIKHRSLRGLRFGIDEIHDHTLILADNPGMRLSNEVANRGGVPVIAARETARLIQTLLDDGPLALSCDDEGMKINLKTVRDGIVVDAGGQPARADEFFAIESLV